MSLYVQPEGNSLMDFWSVAWMVSTIFLGITMITVGISIFITSGEKHGATALGLAVLCAVGFMTVLIGYYVLVTAGRQTSVAFLSLVISACCGGALIMKAHRYAKKRAVSR